jgi:hypothetical protein
MLFDGPPSELPIATLRPSVHGRRRRLVVELAYHGARGVAWLRPRAVPLLVAFASLFVMLGSIKAIAIWDREPLALAMQARAVAPRPVERRSWCTRGVAWQTAGRAPVRILLRPLTPNDHYTELTIGTLDPR